MPPPPPPAGLLPLLPLRGMALLPGVTIPVDLGRPGSVEAVRHAETLGGASSHAQLLVAVQRDPMLDAPSLDDLHPIGVTGELVQVLHGLPGRLTALIRGVERVHLQGLQVQRAFLIGRYTPAVETMGDPTLAVALAGALQDLVQRHDELLSKESNNRQRQAALAALRSERAPGRVADMVAAHVDIDTAARLELMQDTHVPERLRRCLELVAQRINVLSVKRDVDKAVRDVLAKGEQQAILRHKLRAIQSELGGDDERDAVAELSARLDARAFPEEAALAVDRELTRYARMNPQSGEGNVTRTWLEWMADLPWGERDASVDQLDLGAAKVRLESEHFGMEKAKRRIVEYLSVRKLAPDKRGPILCLAGPPGTGKTSLARSIADALGREFVRISLGGVRDEAEVRGHRRTYVGAIPGRFIHAMKQAKTSNPVILLDEIDKLGSSESRGDPAAALLEALDPEQNSAFEDHYLGVPYDLSKVVFIATANEFQAIKATLRDRLEVLFITGYTIEEKLKIATDHLLPRLQREHGLSGIRFEVTRALVEAIATRYTRESGVRDLQRGLSAVMRHVAMLVAEDKMVPDTIDVAALDDILGPARYFEDRMDKTPRIGVAHGLGWTPTGGRLLFVEAIPTRGRGQLRLTGSLGGVMKESGQTALSYVRTHAQDLGIPVDFLERLDLHVHLPEGAIPKDGPSAGIALTTALVSILTGRPVRHDLAMTGEITLLGRVLAVGGIREKVLAAHRAGIYDIVLPSRNRKDEPEIPERARADLRLHYVDDVREVLELALLAPAARGAA
jgi:ATP-dependent Lon protease